MYTVKIISKLGFFVLLHKYLGQNLVHIHSRNLIEVTLIDQMNEIHKLLRIAI
jgi:hypothetical protein